MPLRLLITVVILIPLLLCCQTIETEFIAEGSEGNCPPWYFPDEEGKCRFDSNLPQIIRQFGNTSELQIGLCMTVTNSSLVVAQCPFIPTNSYNDNNTQYHSIYQVLPKQLDQVNSYLCEQFNRKGFLCTECKDGYGLAAYRYYGLMCVECSNSSWKLIGYIILLFIPQTILFLIFLLLNINVHSGNLTGFIYFSHVLFSTTFFFPSLVILSQEVIGYWPMQIVLALYGVWSLEFLQFLMPPFCVSTHLTELQLISLGYVSSIYPLILCIITYYLIELHAKGNRILIMVWKPFQRLLKSPSNMESSIIHTFGTFILLSYSKNLFVSFTLIQGSVIVAMDRNTSTLTSLPSRSVDLGAHYFGSTHAPYGALGVLGCFLTVILPLVLVLLYPTRLFPKLIQCCGLRRWHAIRTFMEVFVGTYKDGTGGENNERDYRFIASVYLIGRIVIGIFLTKRGITDPLIQHFAWLISAVPYILVAVCFAFFKPHRKSHHNAIDVLMFLLLAKMNICYHIVFETSISERTLYLVLLTVLIDAAIPQLVLAGFLVYNTFFSTQLKGLKQLIKKFIKKRKNQEFQPILVK